MVHTARASCGVQWCCSCRSGGKDTDALAGSRKLGKNVRLIRRIKGANPLQQPRPLHSQYVYVYCGLYEVLPYLGGLHVMLTLVLPYPNMLSQLVLTAFVLWWLARV